MAGGDPRQTNLRPMGVGEVVDAGFGFARHNYRFLVTTAAWAIVPGFFVASAIDFIFPVGNLGSLAMLVAAFLASVAVALACGSIVDPNILPRRASPAVIYRAALNRLPSLLVLGILATILVLPLFVIVPLGIFLAVRWSMIFNAAILEQRGPIPAIRESWRMTRGSFWHTLGVLVIAFILGLVFSYVVEAIFGAIDLVLVFVVKNATAVGIVGNLGNGLSTLLVTPFTIAINVMLFYELKSRSAGFDLILRSHQLRSAE